MIPVGPGGDSRALLESARRGDITWIAIDMPCAHPNALRRPFAGMAREGFAVGAARIARLARCPVVLCVPVRMPDGSVRVEWGDVTWPHEGGGREADEQVTDQLLSHLERLVGEYPDHYLFPIGWDRRWDAARRAWTERQDCGAALAMAATASPQALADAPSGTRTDAITSSKP